MDNLLRGFGWVRLGSGAAWTCRAGQKLGNYVVWIGLGEVELEKMGKYVGWIQVGEVRKGKEVSGSGRSGWENISVDSIGLGPGARAHLHGRSLPSHIRLQGSIKNALQEIVGCLQKSRQLWKKVNAFAAKQLESSSGQH